MDSQHGGALMMAAPTNTLRLPFYERDTSATPQRSAVPRRKQLRHHPDWQCRYPGGICTHPRDARPDGRLHQLCREHRRRANENQRRSQQRRCLVLQRLVHATGQPLPSKPSLPASPVEDPNWQVPRVVPAWRRAFEVDGQAGVIAVVPDNILVASMLGQLRQTTPTQPASSVISGADPTRSLVPLLASLLRDDDPDDSAKLGSESTGSR